MNILKYGKEKIKFFTSKKISGIDNIKWIEDFKDIFHKVSMESNRFYFNKNEHYRARIIVETREMIDLLNGLKKSILHIQFQEAIQFFKDLDQLRILKK